MNKNHFLKIPVTEQENKQIQQNAKALNRSLEEHIITSAIDITPVYVPTVNAFMVANTVMNILNSYNRIPKYVKKIEKELSQYVRNQN